MPCGSKHKTGHVAHVCVCARLCWPGAKKRRPEGLQQREPGEEMRARATHLGPGATVKLGFLPMQHYPQAAAGRSCRQLLARASFPCASTSVTGTWSWSQNNGVSRERPSTPGFQKPEPQACGRQSRANVGHREAGWGTGRGGGGSCLGPAVGAASPWRRIWKHHWNYSQRPICTRAFTQGHVHHTPQSPRILEQLQSHFMNDIITQRGWGASQEQGEGGVQEDSRARASPHPCSLAAPGLELQSKSQLLSANISPGSVGTMRNTVPDLRADQPVSQGREGKSETQLHRAVQVTAMIRAPVVCQGPEENLMGTVRPSFLQKVDLSEG